MGNGLVSACIYGERSSRYGEKIKQRSFYTPYHSIIFDTSNATKEAIWVRSLYARILYGKATELLEYRDR